MRKNVVFPHKSKARMKRKRLNCLRKAAAWPFCLLSAVRGIRIQTRLMGSFFILSLVPLLVTGIFSYSRSSSAMKAKISTYSVQLVDQVGKNIQRELERLAYDSVDIALSDIVQETLQRDKDMGEFDRHNASLLLQENVVKKFSFLHYVSDVLLYTNDSRRIIAYGDNSMFGFVLEPLYLEKLLGQAKEENGAPVWAVVSRDNEVHLVDRAEIAGDRRYGILICRSIRDLSAGSQTGCRSSGTQIGYIVIRTNEKYISDIYRDIDIGAGADIFILDSEGYVVSAREPETGIGRKYQKDISRHITGGVKSGARVVKSESGGEAFLIAFSPIENTDWFVVSVIPFSYLNRESENIGSYTLTVGIICFFLAVLLSLFISKSISLPLKRLIQSMNEAKKGDLSAGVSDGSRDEIARVAGHYNDMLCDIQALLESVKSKENQKRAAELKALQAQINPHFLSNTLNTAKWLAGVQNAKNIEKLLTALIDLLHASIGKGGELVSLGEEIEYLKNYIALQEFRYSDKFQVRFEVQKEALDLKILKFLLQPLVENSIIHGIEPMEGKGLIVVKAVVIEEHLMIRIADNGVGIPPKTLKELLAGESRPSKSRFSGIGVSNVEERIKLFFGEQYGIHMESVPYLFTTIELLLPAVRGEA